jgi:uncharacterized protein YxjI
LFRRSPVGTAIILVSGLHPLAWRKVERTMHAALNRNLYLVKEQVGLFKASNNYDVYDPETNQVVLQCREERLGLWTKLLRFTDYKRLTPFEVIIRTPDGQPVLCVRRGMALFRSVVDVLDEGGQRIGGYRQTFFSIYDRFSVVGVNDQPLCTLRGNWTSWDFKFMAGETELARVSKKWTGLSQELFTSADNYVLSIADDVPHDNPIRGLIFGAVMCIDLVLKE